MANQGPKPTAPDSLARSLGKFVGHLWTAVSGASTPGKTQIRREVEERRVDTPEGPVTLRRTTIEEIELPPPRN